jgi:hypothetical protein
MKQPTRRRLALVAALSAALVPFVLTRPGPAQQPRAADKTRSFDGKVVPLSGPLEKFGARLAPEAEPHWLALVTRDGKVYPLIEDDGSLMFFKDKSLRGRPMRLTGRLFADTHLLQVVDVHSFKSGRLNEVYYWCDICSIRRNWPGPCECCGRPMVLREEPVK